MSNETTIFGPPGTGKTTALITIIKDHLISKSVDPKSIGFMSFSKKAATEARERASRDLNLDYKDMIYFRTLHSLAFSWLGLSTSQVMSGRDYNELGKLVGLDFRTTQTINIEEGPLFNIGAGGDKYMSLIQYARVKQVDLEEEFHKGWDQSLDKQQLRILDKAFMDYKIAKGKYDFIDMIEKFIEQGTSPKFHMLFIDEAQDLAPLQWKMVKEVLVPNSNQVYYAGDDDQAIYSWMGVDVKHFLNASKNKIILKKSYRVPNHIHTYAADIASKISKRETKEWEPTEDKGMVTWHNDILDVDMREGEWLILTRTNYIANKVCQSLRDEGYVFWREGEGWSVSLNVLVAIEVWLKLQRGASVPADLLKPFAKLINPRYITKSGRKLMYNLQEVNSERPPDEGYSLTNLERLCEFTANNFVTWQNVLKVSEQVAAYIVSVRRRGERILSATPRIRVSTIHRAKGGEADKVALLMDSTKACAESEDQDAERRVWYVGITRAKKELHIVESDSKWGFNIISGDYSDE
jgi:DNA helicase-2/ATP-dependent DNA helicase PcrA